MKKLIPYILLPFLFSCNNQQPASGTSGTNNTPAPPADKRMQTVQKFIGYLKKNDTKNALNMLDYWDSTANLSVNEQYVIRVLSEIDSAEKAVNLCGINDTTWKSEIDTFPNSNRVFIFKSVKLNWKTGEPLSDRALLFSFEISKPDTFLHSFIFEPLY